MQHELTGRYCHGLLQRDVAQVLGVNGGTVYNWENHRTQPALNFVSKVFKFLGYALQIDSVSSIGEKLLRYRRLEGLSQKRLASLLRIDPSTLSRWERGLGIPGTTAGQRLFEFLRSVDSTIAPPGEASSG